jgi:hypothetical protein
MSRRYTKAAARAAGETRIAAATAHERAARSHSAWGMECEEQRTAHTLARAAVLRQQAERETL